MFSSTMRSAVLQATVLFTLSILVENYTGKDLFAEVWEDEGFVTMFNMMYNNSKPNQPSTKPVALLGADAGNLTSPWTFNSTAVYPNGTTVHESGIIINGTTNGTSSMKFEPERPFYSRVLPQEIVVFIILAALQYWWHLALERMLPARPRGKVQVERYEKAEESEDREEEVVKKWIAQGRVRRASLNWCNTFLKWVLELTVGRFWYHTVQHLLRVLVRLESPKTIVKDMFGHLVFNFLGAYFSIAPLATLMAFILIPAHKRIVFMAGFDVVVTLFVQTSVRMFTTWAIKTDFLQATFKNMTETANKTRIRNERLRRLGDEL